MNVLKIGIDSLRGASRTTFISAPVHGRSSKTLSFTTVSRFSVLSSEAALPSARTAYSYKFLSRKSALRVGSTMALTLVSLQSTGLSQAECEGDKGGRNLEDMINSVKSAVSSVEISKFTEAVQGVVQGTTSADDLKAAAGEQIDRMIETGLPGQLSWGFMMGMCSGFAVKKTAKVAAFTVGLAFVGLQALSYTGHINVDYAKVTKSAITALDQNNDGKIDKEDYKIGYDKLMEVLTFNLPAGSGFGVGFISGVRMG